jgi:hypothetical protein
VKPALAHGLEAVRQARGLCLRSAAARIKVVALELLRGQEGGAHGIDRLRDPLGAGTRLFGEKAELAKPGNEVSAGWNERIARRYTLEWRAEVGKCRGLRHFLTVANREYEVGEGQAGGGDDRGLETKWVCVREVLSGSNRAENGYISV